MVGKYICHEDKVDLDQFITLVRRRKHLRSIFVSDERSMTCLPETE